MNREIILQFFKQREEIFLRLTKRIFESLPQSVLEGIKDFLNLENGAKLLLEDIDLIERKDNEPLVVIMGTIKYLPGSRARLQNGSEVIITPETSSYFQRLMRVGLPLSVIEEDDRQRVIDFLTQTVVFEEADSVEKMSAVQKDHDFNVDSLSTEQKDALKLFLSMQTAPGEKN